MYGVLQQTLSKYFGSESGDVPCEQFNKFVNTLKREKQNQIKISMVRCQVERY